jgi:translation initiation factor 3 subunit B
MYVTWSPKGSHLVTFHKQGVALWGGPSWKKIGRFAHPNVKLVDFSPNENYMVTWSHETFTSPEGRQHVSLLLDNFGSQMRKTSITQHEDLMVHRIC